MYRDPFELIEIYWVKHTVKVYKNNTNNIHDTLSSMYEYKY